MKRLLLPKWIGLVHHSFVKCSLFNRVHPPRMTSWLFGRTLICPSRMNCTLLLPCSLPREISMRSCSHGRCVRSGARIWWIPPPRCMRSENWKESSRLYSWDSQQVLFFKYKSGVVLNVLTTGLFQIQQSSHKSSSTLCLPECQVKLAEQGVDQDETKDARPCVCEWT